MRIIRALSAILMFISIINSGTPFFFSACGSTANYTSEFDQVGEFQSPIFWSPDHGVTFNRSHSNNFSSVLDHHGDIHVVWEDDRDNISNIYFVKMRNLDGQKLINDFKVSHSLGPAVNPRIAVDEPNRIYIMWQEYTGAIWNIYFSELRYDKENIILYRDRLLVSGLNTPYPVDFNIEMGGSNIIHMVLEDAEAGIQNIYYQSFSTIFYSILGNMRLTNTPGNSSSPQIITENNGHIHLIWMDEEDENSGLYYKKFDDRLHIMIPRRRLTVTGESTRFDFATDSHGDIHVVFDDNRYHNHKRDIIYTKLDGEGRTLIDDTLVTPRENKKDSFGPSLTVNQMDEVYIVWSDGRNYDHKGDDEYELYQAPVDIYIQRMDENFFILGESIRLTGDMSRSVYPVIMTDDNNEQHLLWVDDKNGLQNIYYKRTEKSDLILESVVMEPQEPVIHENITFAWHIYNEGIFSVDTSFHIYQGQSPQGEIIKVFQLAILPEEFASISINIITDIGGMHYLTGILNEGRELDEPDYRNNIMTLGYFVSDLTISLEPLESTSTLFPWELAEFRYRIHNKGNIDQNISVRMDSDGPFNMPDEKIYYLARGENVTSMVNLYMPTNTLSLEYSLNIHIRSTLHENFSDEHTFTFMLESVIDFEIFPHTYNITDLEAIEYSTHLTVRNTGNVELYIWILLLSDRYTVVGDLDPEGAILLPGESQKISLEFNRSIDHRSSSTITVVAQADDIVRTIDIHIVGEEPEERISWFSRLPWFWIIVVMGLVVGFFLARVLLNKIITSDEKEE